MKLNTQDLLAKPMDRKGFLKYIGSILLALLGISRLISLLTHTDGRTAIHSNLSSAQGYGTSAYGGSIDTQSKPLGRS